MFRVLEVKNHFRKAYRYRFKTLPFLRRFPSAKLYKILKLNMKTTFFRYIWSSTRCVAHLTIAYI